MYVNFHRVNDLAVFFFFSYDYFVTVSRFSTLRHQCYLMSGTVLCKLPRGGGTSVES